MQSANELKSWIQFFHGNVEVSSTVDGRVVLLLPNGKRTITRRYRRNVAAQVEMVKKYLADFKKDALQGTANA